MSKLPDHLFCSESDGALYDTRIPGWSKLPPLRAIYRGGQREISTCAELKAALRHGEFAWPGGYQMYFITSDGAALSFDAVRSELRSILDSVQTRSNDGWRVVGVDINYEDNDLHCDHTGKQIPSAYSDDSDGTGMMAISPN